jgi:predicted nucleic acid-binding protein
MTFTINDCFVDSSILIEYNKGNKLQVFNQLQKAPDTVCYINEVVISEFLFYYLANNGNKAPKTLQMRGEIKNIFTEFKQYNLIKLCQLVPNDNRLFSLVPQFMSKYNLLPNDAIILATCKMYGITKLASHDTGFIGPCGEEGIELLIEKA